MENLKLFKIHTVADHSTVTRLWLSISSLSETNLNT